MNGKKFSLFLTIRAVFQWTAGLLTLGIFTLPFLLLGWIDSSKRWFALLARYFCKSILFIAGIRVKTKSPRCFPKRENFLVCANHQGLFDIMALSAQIPLPILYVSKPSYFKIPILGFGMRVGGYLEVSRSDTRHDIQVMKELARQLKSGKSFVMFPEGTRSRDGSIGPFKMGAFHAAVESGVSILPVAITGSRERLPPGRKVIVPGTIRLNISPPISPLGKSPEELRDETRQVILELKAALEKS